MGLPLAFGRIIHSIQFLGTFTICGVVCLHTSVSFINDYWDYKRGIDTTTPRTKFSGGTGVLPEKLLTPKSVYFTGILFFNIRLYYRCIFRYCSWNCDSTDSLIRNSFYLFLFN